MNGIDHSKYRFGVFIEIDPITITGFLIDRANEAVLAETRILGLEGFDPCKRRLSVGFSSFHGFGLEDDTTLGAQGLKLQLEQTNRKVLRQLIGHWHTPRRTQIGQD